MSATYTIAHSDTGSLTYWTRSGIKPASSWILVRFVSTVPQWELPVFVFVFLFFFCILWLHLQHVEVPRLGVKSELKVQAIATAIATAMWDPSRVCNLHHCSWQCQIFNSLSEARDWTCILVVTSWVHSPLSHRGNSQCHNCLDYHSFIINLEVI